MTVATLNLNSIKTFVILGFGKTGYASAKFLLKNFSNAKIKISELKTQDKCDEKLIQELKEANVIFEFGKQSSEFILEQNAFILISPGIKPDAEIIIKIKNSQILHGTDLDIFAACLNQEQNYVAITGTNGKTTCTSLVSHIFNTPSLGNIGKPFLEFDEDNYNNLACEISSFQAYYSEYFRYLKIPKVSIFLNFTADHLDWHSDLEDYFLAKTKLFCESDQEENFWLLNFEDTKIKNFALKKERIKGSKTKICFFANEDISYCLSEDSPYCAYEKDNRIYLAKYIGSDKVSTEETGIISLNSNEEYFLEIPLVKTEELKVVGKHNYSNTLAASLCAYLMGFDLDYIIEALQSFKPVAHRLEFIKEIGNNKIFNDSKATNPDSTIKALSSFDQSIVILGGKNKNLDLSDFLETVSKKAYAVIAIGELKNKISDTLVNKYKFDKVRKADNLEQAFSQAMLYATNNNFPILLSPASSSFDMFKGFEDRGNQFREIVLNYEYCNK